MTGELAITQRWLDAINSRDAAAAAALSQDQIEVVGPRGRGPIPHTVLSEWLARSGFSAIPTRWFCGGDGRVVVELDAQWTDPATGAPRENLLIGAFVRVTDGRLAAFHRFDTGVADALVAAGLAFTDAVGAGRAPAVE